MRTMKSVQVAFAGALLSLSAPTWATSELHRDVTAAYVGEFMANLPADADINFILETSVPAHPEYATKAIIDVFSYPDRALIQEAWPSPGDPGAPMQPARMTLHATGYVRRVYVVIRGTPDLQSFTEVNLVVTRRAIEPPNASTVFRFPTGPINSGANLGRMLVPSGLVANTHIGTTERRLEAQDTVLLVLDNGRAVAFDDDSGLARMSWMHLNQACPSVPGNTCEILVGARTTDKGGLRPWQTGYDVPTRGRTTLVWDEDAHNPGGDLDGDGLGNALEDSLGTDKLNPDSDGDGIPDGVEVIGVGDDPSDEGTPVSLTRFPMYGADPLKRDLFIEADWYPECFDTDPSCVRGNLPLPMQKDRWQWRPSHVRELAALFPSEIAVHMDIGEDDSTVPGNGTVFGNWGGAELLSDALVTAPGLNYCTGMSPAREGYFTHAYAVNWLKNAGRCTKISHANISGTAHELGHYLGLQHWGNPDATERTNCRPNYLSVMGYSYVNEGNQNARAAGGAWFGQQEAFPAFSTGTFSSVILNAFALNEILGFGPAATGTQILDFLEEELGLMVDKTNGFIDWNRNGRYDNGLVRGLINSPAFDGGDCDRGPSSIRGNFEVKDIARPTLAVRGGALRLYGLVPADSASGRQRGLLLDAEPDVTGCGLPGMDACTHWRSGSAQPGTTVYPNPAPGAFAPAVAGGLLVYADQTGQLLFFRLPAAGATTVATRAIGGPLVTGDLAGIERPSGVVSIYAPVNGELRRWDYDPGLDMWTMLGINQFWLPGAAGGAAQVIAVADVGIGLTWGYQRALPGEPQFPGRNLYAAIMAVDATGTRSIELARLDGAEFTLPFVGGNRPIPPIGWTRLSSAVTGRLPRPTSPGALVPLHGSRLGLAFRPEDPGAADPKPGRFYVTWQELADDGSTIYEAAPMMAYTRGNLYSGTTNLAGIAETLTFNWSMRVVNFWTSWASGLSLTYFDGAVRGAAQTMPSPRRPSGSPPLAHDLMSNPQSSFFPNVDGIFNLDQHDHDDVTFMKSHMSWALKQ